MKIVVLDGYTLNPSGDNPWTPLEMLGELTVYDRTPDASFVEHSQGAGILITNKTPLSAERIAALPELRCIGVAATGYDVIDIKAAGKRGIPVINVAAYGVESVAQHAMALLLELCRHTALHDQSVRRGEWAVNADWCYWKTPQLDLCGKVMGIVGFGNNGRRVGSLAHAFGMEIIAHDAFLSANSDSLPDAGYPFQHVDMETLFARSDVISLHCPLTDQTRHLVNAQRLATMKDGALVINTARGPLLDEEAVATALTSGKLGGLGTDVLSVEPVQPDNPLLNSPNTLITPHIAWAAVSARRNITRILSENLAAWLRGEPKSIVNTLYL